MSNPLLSSLNPIPFDAKLPAADKDCADSPASMLPGFDELFGKAVLPMWIFDTETLKFLAVNDAAIERYGWSREEFLAMTVDQIHEDKDVPSFLEYRRRVEFGVSGGLNKECDWQHRTKGGETVAVEAVSQLVNFAGRKAIHATLMDRTEQLHAEQENRELAHVLNLATDAIIVCNLEREILFWNQGAAKLYGWSADEAVGKKVHELFKVDMETVLKCMSGLLEKGDWSSQMNHVRKDGGKVVANTRWTLARDEETNDPNAVLLISTDITEAKNFESQFLRAQRLESLGTLASGIAHDLNNILSPILMATGIMRQSPGADAQKMLQIIESSAERGAGIVKQVLTFARGAEGERVLLQPKHLITEMTKVMMQTFPKNIDIQTNFSAEPWLLLGDATQLHQVLLNLCVNARDAMGTKGGTLRVACENMEVDQQLANMNPGAKLGPHVCFSVTDTGSGMTSEVMEKIFDPFFTTKEQGKGTGLGLATVIGIVKGHKGFLTVQSQLGVGTTFKVFLPANREAKSQEKKDEDATMLKGNGELVLVVDDEAPIREAIAATLEANNYHCYTAEDGTDALALYFERRTAISVVVTDLHMAIMDGIELVRSLRKLTPDVKVIVSSGHVQKENQTILQSLGVKTFLEKPYTAEKLLRSVKAMISPTQEM